MYVVLVYDISIKDHKGSRIMRQVFKKCKEYLN
jgi:CRISPR/Cas system-associated endoribonuclease Cas2